MSDASATALRDAIADAIPERPFNIEFWDGNKVEATEPDSPTVTFKSPVAVRHAVRTRGELGLGRAYVTGEIDVDDLDKIMLLFGRWKAPPMSAAQKARLARAAAKVAGLKKPPPPPAAELQPARNRHSKKWDSDAVRHHYDVSNEFFALFLDESMTYSCALFADGAKSLEEAQFAKLDLVCRKLDLGPDKRLLDIGCGWGSMGIHAAREFGAQVTGITLSPPQAEGANLRAREAGVGELCDFRVQDYRELGGETFDAVSSIGMIEHVGEPNIDEYAQHFADAIAPGGLGMNHGITWNDTVTHIGADFSERYVFPGGEIPPLSRVLAAFEKAEMETLHVENLHRDYTQTLWHWAQRLDQNLEEAERLAGTERLRVWRLYLRAARNGFETGLTSVYQTMLSRPIEERAGELQWPAQPASRRPLKAAASESSD